MAGTTAPLLSFGASGQVAKSVVFSKWKGVTYARKYTIPANPNTSAQQTTRNTFKWVHDAFKWLDPNVVESWTQYAKGKPLTNANAWASKNMVALRGQANNDAIIPFAAANAGPPSATNTSSAAGGGGLTVVGTAPVLPSGWSVVHGILWAMLEQAPTGEKEPNPSLAAVVASPGPYTHTFPGLTPGNKYVCNVGFKYQKPDGSFAYNGSTNVVVTIT